MKMTFRPSLVHSSLWPPSPFTLVSGGTSNELRISPLFISIRLRRGGLRRSGTENAAMVFPSGETRGELNIPFRIGVGVPPSILTRIKAGVSEAFRYTTVFPSGEQEGKSP